MWISKYWLSLVFVVIFMSTSVFAGPATDARLYENADIEAQLDNYLLRYSQGELTVADLEQIVKQITPSTPILTQTRGQGYYALASFNDETRDDIWRRSEERRVGKECRSRWWRDRYK